MIVEIDEFRTTVIALYYCNSGWMRKESKPVPSEGDVSRTEKARKKAVHEAVVAGSGFTIFIQQHRRQPILWPVQLLIRNHSGAPHHHTACHTTPQRAEWLIHWGVVTAPSKMHAYAIRA
jgi:hypothetical protein